MFLCLSAFSQNVDSSSSGIVDESSILLSSSSSSEQVVENQSTNTFGLFFRMIVVLIIIIGLIYGFVWLLRKTSSPKAKDDLYLKEVANLSLAPGKSVRIISLKDKAYMIGVTDSNINLITEVQDKDLIDAMNLNADENPSDKPKDFASLLASFSKSTKNTESYLRERVKSFSETEIDK